MAGRAEDLARQRLDKWLWHVRLQPTRSKAAGLVREGFARINGQRATDPAKAVKPGDVLTLALPGRTIVVRVIALLPARAGAPIAQTAYEPVGPESPQR